MTSDEVRELKMAVKALEAEVERLSTPPYVPGTVIEVGTKTLKVSRDGEGVIEVTIPANLKNKPARGNRLVLNQAGVVLDYSEFGNGAGEIATVDEVKGDRLKVNVRGEKKLVFSSLEGVKAGDEVLVDGAGIALERFDRKETRYELEEVKPIFWEQIGGLEQAIKTIKEEVEMPFLHQSTYARYGISPPKGILLYGPPGCGKTLIAKAIAYNIGSKFGKGKTNFINIKGPELLEKWVGNTEANIRHIYAVAREKAAETNAPVFVFIDEAESICQTRGTGVSSDVNNTIVPQLLAEMDGINGANENRNVITLLATNREDIIDPAVLRDGRVDRRIKIPRPNREGTHEIFKIYLKGKPTECGLAKIFTSADKIVDALAKAATDNLFAENNVVYRVRVPQKDGRVLGEFKASNLVSGAMIKGIVNRAAHYAAREEIAVGKPRGFSQPHLDGALHEEFTTNNGFSQTLSKDDWVSVFGAQGAHYYSLANQGYLVIERAKLVSADSSSIKSTGGIK